MTQSLSLFYPPDVRAGNFISFLDMLRSTYPIMFDRLFNDIGITNPCLGGLLMQRTLRISPGNCAELYGELANRYGITPCMVTCYRMAWVDHSIRGLHQQLWHEANQRDHEYRPYAPY